MNAEDLMFNDWVEYPKRGVFQITGIGDELSELDEEIIAKTDVLKPLPITEEFLKDNGFYLMNDYWLNNFSFPFVLNKANDEYQLLILNWDNPDEDITAFFINYIHELQHIIKSCKIKKDFVYLSKDKREE